MTVPDSRLSTQGVVTLTGPDRINRFQRPPSSEIMRRQHSQVLFQLMEEIHCNVWF
jgi:hypothetical protein